MTARFKDPFTHNFMMEHNTNYAIDSRSGLHRTLDNLEEMRFIDQRRADMDRVKEEQENRGVGAINNPGEEQPYIPSQPRDEESSFFGSMSSSEFNETMKATKKQEEKDRRYLEARGYDTSQMNGFEVSVSAGARCLESQGYDVSKMDPTEAALKGLEERRKERVTEDLSEVLNQPIGKK